MAALGSPTYPLPHAMINKEGEALGLDIKHYINSTKSVLLVAYDNTGKITGLF